MNRHRTSALDRLRVAVVQIHKPPHTIVRARLMHVSANISTDECTVYEGISPSPQFLYAVSSHVIVQSERL